MMGVRSTEIKGLKMLKCPEEGGTKKDWDDFVETTARDTSVSWASGDALTSILLGQEVESMDPPVDLTAEEKKKLNKYEIQVVEADEKEYVERLRMFRKEKKALYSVLMANVSPLMRQKLEGTVGWDVAKAAKDVVWLIEAMGDVMTNFEKIKIFDLAMDDQMEKIMKARQKENQTNDEFIKAFQTEVKVYEKHAGSPFMWTKYHDKRVDQLVEEAKEEYEDEHSDEDVPANEVASLEKIAKRMVRTICAMGTLGAPIRLKQVIQVWQRG